MRCERFGLGWGVGIGGWYARLNGHIFRADKSERGWFRLALYRDGRYHARGTTLLELSKSIVADECILDHAEHSQECAGWLRHNGPVEVPR